MYLTRDEVRRANGRANAAAAKQRPSVDFDWDAAIGRLHALLEWLDEVEQ